jgi:hypothetical protein
MVNLLSTGIKSVWLGHAWSFFDIRADSPCDASYSDYHKTEKRCILFPIGRLRVPTTGRRPDMLWIAVTCEWSRTRIFSGGRTEHGLSSSIRPSTAASPCSCADSPRPCCPS